MNRRTPKTSYLAETPFGFRRVYSWRNYVACVASADGFTQFCISANGALREARKQRRLGREIVIVPAIKMEGLKLS